MSPARASRTIYRTERREPGFVQVENATIRDARLSFRARGLLAFMLSFPDDWQHRAADVEAASEHEGREAIRTGLKELEALGYRTRTKIQQGDGTWITQIVLREVPLTDDRKPVGRSTGEPVGRTSLEDGHEDGHEDRDPASQDPAQPSLLGEDLPPLKVRKKSARDLLADALGKVYPFVTDGERQRVGMVATKLAKLKPQPTPEEVERRARWARQEYEKGTVFAVEKNWTLIGERLGSRTGAEQRIEEIEEAGMRWGDER